MAAAAAAARRAAAPPAYATVGCFQPCGAPRKNWTRSAPRAAASASGSTWSTWAPMRSVVTIRPYDRGPTARPLWTAISGLSPGPGSLCPWSAARASPADAVALLPRRDRGREVQRRWVVRMRHYELMVILDPDVEERTVAPALDQFLSVVKKDGGNVEKVDIWGRRRMSFEIAKKTEGIYAVVDLQAEPATIKELDRQLTLNESVLRTKVIRPDAR